MFDAFESPGDDPTFWDDMATSLPDQLRSLEAALDRAVGRYVDAVDRRVRVERTPIEDPDRDRMLLEAERLEAKAGTWVDTYEKLVTVYTRFAVIALEHRVELDARMRRGKLDDPAGED